MAYDPNAPAEPLPKAIFDRIFKSVWKASRHFKDATVHAIRRGLGKKVNSIWLNLVKLDSLALSSSDLHREVHQD